MKSLKNDVKAWLLLCSGLGTILFLMGSTFYIVVSQSLGLYSMGGEESQFSLEYWQAVLNSPVFQNSYIYSVKVSLLGAILSIIVAYPIAMWLRKITNQGNNYNHIAGAYVGTGIGCRLLFVNMISYHGILNEVFVYLGIWDEPKPYKMMNLVGGCDFTNVEKHSLCFNSYWWSSQFTENRFIRCGS